MGNGLLAFLFAAGASAWIYNRFMKTTGSQVQRSLMAAAASGVVIFFIVFIILTILF